MQTTQEFILARMRERANLMDLMMVTREIYVQNET